MYNPESERDLKKLRTALSWSRKGLRPFQTRFVDLWRHYAAKQHDEDDFERLLPINMIRMAIDTYSRKLSSSNPSVLVSTTTPGLKPKAYELQLAVDHVLREIKFQRSLRKCVKSALVMMGIMKVGLTDAPMGESLSIYHDSGQPFSDNVLFGNWVHDFNARDMDEWEFCGDKYRVPLDDVKNNPAFMNTENLQPSDRTIFNDGDEYSTDETRIETITQGFGDLNGEEYIDHVELWDIWLPRENLIVTLPSVGDKPLMIREWDGPERGPYHILSFGEIPGNVIPTGAVAPMFDIHDLLNRLMVKVGDQAERQKTIYFATQASAADGSAATKINSEDGDVISTNNTNDVREMRSGGVDQQLLATVGWLRNLSSYVGGNLDVLAGTSSQADTATQEKLLVQQSSGMMDDFRQTVETFVGEVVTDIAWYTYTNPELEIPILKSTPRGSFAMPKMWGPEDREANFFEYAFKITPYSTSAKSPQDKVQVLSAFVRQEVLPMEQAGMNARAGVQFDVPEYYRTMANLLDAPELNSFLKINGGQLPSAPVGLESTGIPSGMPAETTRNYVRESRGGNSGQAAIDRDMMSGAMGASMPQGLNPSPQGAA
jgi:hypothetical protein